MKFDQDGNDVIMLFSIISTGYYHMASDSQSEQLKDEKSLFRKFLVPGEASLHLNEGKLHKFYITK